MSGILAAGVGDWPIIKQIAYFFGFIMNGIYNFMDKVFGIQNIGICIILFTIIIYTLMIPLTLKQQKFSKLSAIMNPEIQKIQKKYQGKRDQTSMMKQQEEMQAVYEKYGTSPTGGCLPLLIQLPLLFALYPVIQNIPKYVKSVKAVYIPIVDKIMATNGWQKIMEKIGSAKPILMSPSAYDYTDKNTLVNVLYKFQDSTWDKLVDKMPSVEETVRSTTQTISHLNSFLGINIAETPINMLSSALHPFDIKGVLMAVLIPLLAGLSQFISMKLQPTPSTNSDDPMMGSMRTMTYTMPLISVFFCFSMPAGIGLYWFVSALVRCAQQLIINKRMSKIPVEELIKKNKEKAAKKRAKKGVSATELSRMATTKTKNINKVMSDKEKEEKLKKAEERMNNAKPGSLAAKAAMVSRYNNSQKEAVKKVKEEQKETTEESKTESKD